MLLSSNGDQSTSHKIPHFSTFFHLCIFRSFQIHPSPHYCYLASTIHCTSYFLYELNCNYVQIILRTTTEYLISSKNDNTCKKIIEHTYNVTTIRKEDDTLVLFVANMLMFIIRVMIILSHRNYHTVFVCGVRVTFNGKNVIEDWATMKGC